MRVCAISHFILGWGAIPPIYYRVGPAPGGGGGLDKSSPTLEPCMLYGGCETQEPSPESHPSPFPPKDGNGQEVCGNRQIRPAMEALPCARNRRKPRGGVCSIPGQRGYAVAPALGCAADVCRSMSSGRSTRTIGLQSESRSQAKTRLRKYNLPKHRSAGCAYILFCTYWAVP